MNRILNKLYIKALEHRDIHDCGAVPFQKGDLLVKLAANAKRVLEIGTGVGFSTICLSLGNKAVVETIDKDAIHIMFAKENCEEAGVRDRVIFYQAKAEDIFPKLKAGYDLIFYDGHVPQRKFVDQFERLLKKGGVALTANLFLSVPSGGKYLKNLNNLSNTKSNKWNTKIIEDNALSVKL